MNNIPKNCDECYSKEWCDSFYGGLGCEYEPVIAGRAVLPGVSMENEEEKKEDVVKEPSHYKHARFETIDEMLIVFGPQKTYDYCIIAAWKYRARAAYKGNFEQDMRKADECLELANKIAEANKMLVLPASLIKE